LTTNAFYQACLFGANFVFAHQATGLTSRGDDLVVTLAEGDEIVAKAVVVATGVEHCPIGVPGLEALTGARVFGARVFYGAAVTEAQAMRGQQVTVVGAGNSAGQAAVYLAQYADQVTLLVRGDDLTKSMSDYLIREIEGVPNVDVRLRTEVVDAVGRAHLESLVLRDRATGQTKTMPVEDVRACF
jgi:thioredoxin reductase (NADPH)